MVGVFYWSGTGNTEAMAQEVAAGIKAAGQDVELKSVSEISAEEAAKYDKLALGCADMGAEQLEEGEFEPWYTDLEKLLVANKLSCSALMAGVVLGLMIGLNALKELVRLLWLIQWLLMEKQTMMVRQSAKS